MINYLLSYEIQKFVINRFRHFVFICSITVIFQSCATADTTFDVVVIGGGTSGIAAGVSSSRFGAKTLLIEKGPWLGGMLTAAGVSAIDGNNKLPSGIWGEFRDSLTLRYGSIEALKTGWVSNTLFEPHVGNEIFQNVASSEPLLSLRQETWWQDISYQDELWVIKLTDGTIVKGNQIIDATELGDVIQHLRVAHRVGMDSRDDFQEYIAPIKSNDVIQDLTYVIILKDYGKPMIIDKPEGYDASVFYCASQNEKCPEVESMVRTLWPKEQLITYGKLPNNKYMINWPINGNDYFVNAIYMNEKERDSSFQLAKQKSLQFLYYLQTELGFSNLSIADDEFPTQDGLPIIPYHRESLRIDGVTTLSINHLSDPYTQEQPLFRTAVAVGDYPVDHHHASHPDWDNLPDLHFYPVPSYSLPFGTLIPKEKENLVVAEKSISVSNIVNGTTRLQPVVLQIGQVAGIISAIAAKESILPRDVSVRKVQEIILSQGGYLLPFLDIPKSHPRFKVLQRIGVTGILRGTGKNIGWENQTWFYPESPLKFEDVFLDEYVDLEIYPLPDDLIYESIFDWFVKVTGSNDQFENITELDLKEIVPHVEDYTLAIKRGDFALLLDGILNPFANPVGVTGNLIR